MYSTCNGRYRCCSHQERRCSRQERRCSRQERRCSHQERRCSRQERRCSRQERDEDDVLAAVLRTLPAGDDAVSGRHEQTLVVVVERHGEDGTCQLIPAQVTHRLSQKSKHKNNPTRALASG